MTKQFNLLQLFSVIDGRLSTNMNDVYSILNHVCDISLMTHHLPVANSYLKEKNPEWFNQSKLQLESDIKVLCPIKEETHEQFIWIMNNMNLSSTIIEVPQLKDEFDTSDFEDYMINNSLFNKL